MVVRTVALTLLRRMLGVLGCGPTPDANEVEIAVLRHQLAVLHRQVARPRYTPADRMLMATLAKLLPRQRWPAFLVTPSTLLRWHRKLVARRWTYPHTGRRARGLDEQVVELVLRLARENPRPGPTPKAGPDSGSASSPAELSFGAVHLYRDNIDPAIGRIRALRQNAEPQRLHRPAATPTRAAACLPAPP